MNEDILVAIISDDPYARNWMSLLLVRDWRTQVVSEISTLSDLIKSEKEGIMKIDMLLLDTDGLFENPEALARVNELQALQTRLKLFCIGSNVDMRVLTRLDPASLCAYILKDEIASSLAWAIKFAAEGVTIYSPTTLQAAHQANISIPVDYMVLQGQTFPGLTDRQEEVARLAIIFSIGRRDLADELNISDQWSYGMVSELYTKLGLSEIFSGDSDPFAMADQDPVIKEHVQEIINELGDSRKARDLETLAFHLLTMPIISK